MGRKEKKYTLLMIILFIVDFTVKILTRSKIFVDWDGPQYAIAIEHYSLKENFPGLPGHFLYVMAAKFLNIFFHNHFNSYIALSIIFSGLVCVALFLIGKSIFSFRTGLVSSFVYIVSPLMLFNGGSFNPFLICGFFSLVAGYFMFMVIAREKQDYLIWASLFYAISVGIRPQDVVYLAPLWLFALWKAKAKARIFSILMFVIVSLLWFIPFAIVSGGLRELTSFILGEVNSGSTRLSSSVFNYPRLLSANIKYQILTFFYTFGAGVIVFFYYLPQYFNVKGLLYDKKIQVMMTWIITAPAFWLIYNFAIPSYIIVSLLPMIILVSEFFCQITDDIGGFLSSKLYPWRLGIKNVVLVLSLSILACVNALYYFTDFASTKKRYYPVGFRRYSESQGLQEELVGKIKYIKENIPVEGSIIVTLPVSFMPVMYYLSEYQVYLFKSVISRSNNSAVNGHNWKRNNISDDELPGVMKNIKSERIVFFDDELSEWVKTSKDTQTLKFDDKLMDIVHCNGQCCVDYFYKDIRIH